MPKGHSGIISARQDLGYTRTLARRRYKKRCIIRESVPPIHLFVRKIVLLFEVVQFREKTQKQGSPVTASLLYGLFYHIFL